MTIMNFSTFEGWNVTQPTKFRAPKMAKTVVLELLIYPKLISRKIPVIENPEISTLFCNSHFLLKNS